MDKKKYKLTMQWNRGFNGVPDNIHDIKWHGGKVAIYFDDKVFILNPARKPLPLGRGGIADLLFKKIHLKISFFTYYIIHILMQHQEFKLMEIM